jgi:hypothetical protein
VSGRLGLLSSRWATISRLALHFSHDVISPPTRKTGNIFLKIRRGSKNNLGSMLQILSSEEHVSCSAARALLFCSWAIERPHTLFSTLLSTCEHYPVYKASLRGRAQRQIEKGQNSDPEVANGSHKLRLENLRNRTSRVNSLPGPLPEATLWSLRLVRPRVSQYRCKL